MTLQLDYHFAMIVCQFCFRRAKLHPQKQRSKYICKPEAVVEAGNHFVWEFIPGRGSLNVPADAGILHHYRVSAFAILTIYVLLLLLLLLLLFLMNALPFVQVCEFGGDDCVKAPSIVDRMAQKYSERLIRRVEDVYNQLKVPCNLPDLPSLPTRPPPTKKKMPIFKDQHSSDKKSDTDNNNKQH